jgi:flavin-dependent dehydrogenase
MNNAGGICIIGAGPAGSAAAIRLAQAGLRVDLYEKSRFPRAKLCGGFLSAECLQDLDHLGVLDKIQTAGAIPIRRTLISASWAGYTEAELPSPGLSLSREALDLILLQRARAVGVQVHEASDGFSAATPASWTVVAAGRKAEVGGAYGIQAYFENVEGLSDQIELHLFPGGYAGIVRQDKNRVNLCALAEHSTMRRHGPGQDQILRHWMNQNPLLRQRLQGSKRLTLWQAVGPVRMGFRQLSSPQRLFAGDAACIVDPFVGEGITMSLRTAALIAQAFQQNAEPIESAYERAWHAEFDASLRWHQGLRPLLRYSLTQNLCVAGLKLFPSRLTWLAERTRAKLYAN